MMTATMSPIRGVLIEAILAVMAFAALSFAVLSAAPQIAEPDDGAYHHSIVAVAMGDFLTLSPDEVAALGERLGGRPGLPNQWVRLPDGRAISEKNPGYPYLAAPFEALGIIRWAPLFYAALACVGLFIGARRWLGSFGGAATVGLFCSSGAAIAFAWRDYMPTMADASLVAAGTGLLLWTVVATDAQPRRRTLASLAAFAAIELASFARYTDIVILGVAVLALLAAARVRASKLPGGAVLVALISIGVFAGLVATFDTVVYGGPLKTGYGPGEVTFDLGAIGPNLRIMPAHLVEAMPMLLLALASLLWILVRALTPPRVGAEAAIQDAAPGTGAGWPSARRRDLGVGLALAASWLAFWGLYAAYTWTTDPTSVTVQVVRFYVPAIGAISLLGAWLVTRIPDPLWLRGAATVAAVAVLFVLGVTSFYAMYDAFGVPLGG
jgi:hypothetical protein